MRNLLGVCPAPSPITRILLGSWCNSIGTWAAITWCPLRSLPCHARSTASWSSSPFLMTETKELIPSRNSINWPWLARKSSGSFVLETWGIPNHTKKIIMTIVYFEIEGRESSRKNKEIKPIIRLMAVIIITDFWSPKIGSKKKPTTRDPRIPPTVLIAVMIPTPEPALEGSSTTIRIASGNEIPDKIAGNNKTIHTIHIKVLTSVESITLLQNVDGSINAIKTVIPMAICTEPKMRGLLTVLSKNLAVKALPTTIPIRITVIVKV